MFSRGVFRINGPRTIRHAGVSGRLSSRDIVRDDIKGHHNVVPKVV